MNKVQLIGHVGQDPEIKTFQSGDKYATFSFATSESWKDKQTGEKKTDTEWHRVTVTNTAIVNIIERFVKKGSKLFLEGQNKTRSYEQDGQKKYTTEVVLRPYKGEIILLDGKSDTPAQEQQSVSDKIDDEIPF